MQKKQQTINVKMCKKKKNNVSKSFVINQKSNITFFTKVNFDILATSIMIVWNA